MRKLSLCLTVLSLFAAESLVQADHGSNTSFTYNSVSIPDTRVGKETKTSKESLSFPEDNSDTILDETLWRIDVEYATVFNKVTKDDYLYMTNTLRIPKPDAYPKFSVMLYTQIITSDADPVSHATTYPDFETVSLTTPFYGETDMDKQLWMLNQYKYNQKSDEEELYRVAENVPWNDQLKEYKIDLGNGMLWGQDATESHASFTTQTVESDTPGQTSTASTTTYSFEVAAYRLFSNPLSARQLKVDDRIFFKVGAKIFNDLTGDGSSQQIGNGISTYKTMNVLEGAATLTATKFVLIMAGLSQFLF